MNAELIGVCEDTGDKPKCKQAYEVSLNSSKGQGCQLVAEM